MIMSLSFKLVTWFFFFFVPESHLTDFPQATAWAEAEAELAQAYEHGLGFSFGRLSFTDNFQAKPSQHNTTHVTQERKN